MIMKGRCSNLRHVSRTHRVDLDCPFDQINLDSSTFIRRLRTTEQVTDMLTRGAFTTIQWKSLTRLFDIQPASNLNVDRGLSEYSCSAVSLKTQLAMSNACSSQRDVDKWTVGREARRLLKQSTLRLGKQRNNKLVPEAPIGETQCFITQA